MAETSTKPRNMEPEPEDPFKRYKNLILSFGRTYKRQLIVAAVAICAVFIVGAGVLYFLQQARSNASAMLIQITERYEAVDKDAGAQELEKIKEDFQSLIDEYGYTDAGNMALLQYAGLCFRTGDHGRALALYQRAYDAFEGNPHMSRLALNGMAYTHAAMGDNKKAISLFQKIVDDENPALKDQALFKLGLLYGRNGNPDKSRQAYERLVSEFPDSIFAPQARARLSG
ncbi:MAG: tetratricopeptide repeat protein [Desulfobacterales bacterium]|nr:tetratricopeptide repeat protein [Desulfobacterales bacterium]